MKFSENLQNLRKTKNMSQEDLADKLNVTRQSVSKWESGTSYPEMDKIIDMCKIFDCTIDSLINGDGITRQEPETTFKKITNDISETINDIVKMLSKKDFKGIIKFIVEVALIVLVILILKLPFILVFQLFDNIFKGLGNFGDVLHTIFKGITEVAYIIFGFLFFFYAFKSKFLKEETAVESTHEYNEENSEELVSEKNIKKSSSKNDSFSISKVLTDIIVFCIKIFLFFILCWLALSLVFLAMGLAGVIILLLNKVYIMGALLGVMGCLVFVSLIAEIIFNFIFNKVTNYKKSFIGFLLSIIMIGAAITMGVFGFTKYEYINTIPEGYDLNKKEYVVSYNKGIYLDEHISLHNPKYVIDNSLNNNIKIEVQSYKELSADTIVVENNEIELNNYYTNKIDAKKIRNEIIKNLRDNKIYTYDNYMNPLFTISANKEIIKALQTNTYQNEISELEDECQEELNELNNKLRDYQLKIDSIEENNNELKNEKEEIKIKYETLKERLKDITE